MRRRRSRSRLREATVAALALSVAGAGVLAAGCSSPSSTSRTTVSPPTPSVPSGSSTTSSTTATLSHCQASDLSGSVSGTQGAAGTIELTVKLRNTTSSSCALEGYPGLQLLSSSGTELATDVVRGGSYTFTDFAASAVTLVAGGVSYFNLAYSDVQSGTSTCSSAASMWVTPPDAVDHLAITQAITACNSGTVTVSPVFAAGSAQTDTTAP